MADEWRHIKVLGKSDPRGNLFMQSGGMLESFQVKTSHNRKLLHGQLLRGFLVSLAR